MTPNPILKALSSIRRNGVRALLTGGQACVFYGASEFSRDVDLLVLVAPGNLERLGLALAELHAESIAMPPLEEGFLLAGHGVHFRCGRTDVAGLRIDVLGRLRGLGDFEELWLRRTTIEVAGEKVELMGVADLVHSKKTQRDKDWPMIRRLVEQNYFENRFQPDKDHVMFWLRELRTPQLLIAIATAFPGPARQLAGSRPAAAAAISGDEQEVARCLESEEREERQRDREYWQPLRKELEELRRRRRSPGAEG